MSGTPKVSDAVERVFGLEKFLSTRERGSLQRNRNGWSVQPMFVPKLVCVPRVKFKKNGTLVWYRRLDNGKLQRYFDICRKDAYERVKAEGASFECHM